MRNPRLILITSAALALIASGAAAQTTPNPDALTAALRNCAAVADEAARVRCYDDAVFLWVPGAAAPPVPAAPPPIVSDWRSRSERSPIDDTTNVYLSLVAENTNIDRFGQSYRATLYIACRENTTALWIHFGGEFMADIGTYGNVILRIDSQPAVTVRMNESTNNEALGLWNGGVSIPWVRRLMEGDRLFVRATPYNENARDFDFTIAGLDAEIEPLRAACHW